MNLARKKPGTQSLIYDTATCFLIQVGFESPDFKIIFI
jgi:hypothetical protein